MCYSQKWLIFNMDSIARYNSKLHALYKNDFSPANKIGSWEYIHVIWVIIII